MNDSETTTNTPLQDTLSAVIVFLPEYYHLSTILLHITLNKSRLNAFSLNITLDSTKVNDLNVTRVAFTAIISRLRLMKVCSLNTLYFKRQLTSLTTKTQRNNNSRFAKKQIF